MGLLLLATGSCKGTTPRMQALDDRKDQKNGDTTVAVSMSIQQNPQDDPTAVAIINTEETSSSSDHNVPKRPTDDYKEASMPKRRKPDTPTSSGRIAENEVRATVTQPSISPLQKALAQHVKEHPAEIIISYLDSPKSLLEKLGKVHDVKSYKEVLEAFTIFARQGHQLCASALLRKIALPVISKLFELAVQASKDIKPAVKAVLGPLVELVESKVLQYQDIDVLISELDNIENKDIMNFFSSKKLEEESCRSILSAMIDSRRQDASAERIIFCVVKGFISVLAYADEEDWVVEHTLFRPLHPLVRKLDDFYSQNKLLGVHLCDISHSVAQIALHELVNLANFCGEADSSKKCIVETSKPLINFWSKAAVDSDEDVVRKAHALIVENHKLCKLANADDPEEEFRKYYDPLDAALTP